MSRHLQSTTVLHTMKDISQRSELTANRIISPKQKIGLHIQVRAGNVVLSRVVFTHTLKNIPTSHTRIPPSLSTGFKLRTLQPLHHMSLTMLQPIQITTSPRIRPNGRRRFVAFSPRYADAHLGLPCTRFRATVGEVGCGAEVHGAGAAEGRGA